MVASKEAPTARDSIPAGVLGAAKLLPTGALVWAATAGLRDGMSVLVGSGPAAPVLLARRSLQGHRYAPRCPTFMRLTPDTHTRHVRLRVAGAHIRAERAWLAIETTAQHHVRALDLFRSLELS